MRIESSSGAPCTTARLPPARSDVDAQRCPTRTDDRHIRKTMAGIRRINGAAPRRKSAIRKQLLRQLALDLPDTP